MYTHMSVRLFFSVKVSINNGHAYTCPKSLLFSMFTDQRPYLYTSNRGLRVTKYNLKCREGL